MLRCTIEIVPWGDEERRRVIEVIEIANISDPPNADSADYACMVRGSDSLFGPGKSRAIAYVHKHKRNDGAAKLVAKAIQSLDWSEHYGKPKPNNRPKLSKTPKRRELGLSGADVWPNRA